jgi:hypothetical protein
MGWERVDFEVKSFNLKVPHHFRRTIAKHLKKQTYQVYQVLWKLTNKITKLVPIFKPLSGENKL